MQAGNHKARVVDFDFGFSGTGTEQIAVCFEILEGECTGEHMTWYGFFTDKTAERTIGSLRDLGWTGDYLFGMKLEEIQEPVFLVIQPKKDDEDRLEIRFINKAGSGTVAMKTRMNEQQKKAFADKMRGLCMGSATTKTPARPAPKAATAPHKPAPRVGDREPGDDDDMPNF